MKTIIQIVSVVLLASSFCKAESQAERSEGTRGKRAFGGIHSGVVHRHGIHVGGDVAARTYALGGAFPKERDDLIAGVVAKSSAVAAASNVASFKRAKAFEISRAAQAAQAVAFGESSLASKTTSAVKAAERTAHLAVSLGRKLRDAFSEIEALTSQASKSLGAAKMVQAAQDSMLYEAQREADALSQRQFYSLSELQAAQAAANKAQTIASSTLAGHSSTGLHGAY